MVLDLSYICLLKLVTITKLVDLIIGAEALYLDGEEIMGVVKLTVRPCKDDDKVVATRHHSLYLPSFPSQAGPLRDYQHG